jgi:hypothetical protein
VIKIVVRIFARIPALFTAQKSAWNTAQTTAIVSVECLFGGCKYL